MLRYVLNSTRQQWDRICSQLLIGMYHPACGSERKHPIRIYSPEELAVRFDRIERLIRSL